MRNVSMHEGRHPIVIIGAGPYGLSIAAHLDEAGIPYRIFGGAMQMWREHMPAGMTMKSDGFASNLSAGHRRHFTFRHFCEERRLPYIDRHHPMPLEHFIAYGLEFQRRFVHRLDTRHVAHIDRNGKQFTVTLEDGETVHAGSVICATGIMHFPIHPKELSALTKKFLTHSSDHATYAHFRDQRVAVLGAGASAMHAAALLQEHGADVTVIARTARINFHEPPTGKSRSLYQRLRHPSSKLGSGMRSWLSEKAPQAFHALPEALRHKIVQKHLGPSSSWHLKNRVEGKAHLLLSRTVAQAEATAHGVKLTLNHHGQPEEISVDHIIAATGFRVDLRRLSFLSHLLNDLRLTHGAPALDRTFQSSIPGLYFVGTPSAPSFGPLLRFAAGATFAARTLTRALTPLENRLPSQLPWQIRDEHPPLGF